MRMITLFLFVFCHKMHLHMSFVLLFILHTGGFSLDCYSCYNQLEFPCKENIKCFREGSMCASFRSVRYFAGRKQENFVATCAMPRDCKRWSITATPYRMEDSVQCCNTDLCNERSAPDLNAQPNGKKCYTCNWEGCSQTVNRWGNENYCFTANENTPHSSLIMKGCASEFACELSGRLLGPNANVTCCEGNLCNAAESVTQSFLFLCSSLIFYFLLL